MMKKIFNHKKAVLAFLLALVMVVGLVPFTATEVQAQEIDVNATMEGANFEDGQVMTVAIQSRTNGVWKSDFFKYTYQGGEWVSNNPMKVSDFNVLENIYMYIGYSNLNGWELNECLNYDQYMTDESNRICDQSAGFLNFDWMVPTEEITLPTAENPVITAHFIHGLAKVTVGNITYGSEYEITPEITDVRFKSFDSSRYNDPYDNIENEFIGWNINYGIIDVKPFEDKTNGTYTAMLVTNRELNNDDEIIIPTEWTFMTLKVNGEEKEVKLVDDPATDKNEALLEAGKHYEFDLKVGKDKVTLTPTTTDTDFPGGWNNEVTLDGGSATDTQDEGKTAWVDGDQIIATLTSQYYGEQTAMLTFSGSDGTWSTDESFSYLEDETPTVSAIYAPCYEVVDGNMQLKDGMQLGMTEYILAACSVTDGILNISFDGAIRNYSRLRIFALPGQTLTVTTTDFTPAGATKAATEAYTLTADENGNVYLYGTFAEGATISVKQGEVTLADYTFTADKNPNGTEHNKSYALDARPIIDGTLGGKTEATEEDVNALVEQLKAYVDNGITTIIVPGSNPAMIDMVSWTNTAIGEAIYRLSGSDDYDENNPYNGKIDLILPDVTEIVDQEFYSAWALNSITLPKVIKIGDEAFHRTWFLKTITFESVLTEVNETGGVMFAQVGKEVEGCDLILNCGQMNESSVPAPDLTNNIWKFKFENEFKSITLTHTGACDECNAAE